MKNLTTCLIGAFAFYLTLSCAFTRAQDANKNRTASSQREEEILRLREQLMKLEGERSSTPALTLETDGATHFGDLNADTSSLDAVRSGSFTFGSADLPDAVESIRAPLTAEYPTIVEDALPANSTWFDQSATLVPMQFPMPPVAISQPAYSAPVIEHCQRAVVEPVPAPVEVQAVPAPQVAPTIIVNIYQQQPAAPNNFFPPILAPIYNSAPLQYIAPRRSGCCLFGRR